MTGTVSAFTQHSPAGRSDALNTAPSQSFLRLPHPRTGIPCLFLLADPSAPSTSKKSASPVLEVQSIAPDAGRSWFFGNNTIVQDGKLLVLTPIDPAFLLISFFMSIATAPGTATQFRPLEDILEDATTNINASIEEQSQQGTITTVTPQPLVLDEVLRFARSDYVKLAAQRICEFKEISEDLIVFRLCRNKLRDHLRTKVARISDTPIYDSFQTLARGLAKDGLGEEAEGLMKDLRQSARVRGACDVLAQYLPPDVAGELVASFDFNALEAHHQALRDEESTTVSAKIAKENTAPKEAMADTGKKAKGGKNATPSQGVKKLSKVNVQGMSKLNTFFTKKDKV
ncbi:hypothetical protein FRB96_008751 [Tulasnella sp. 330]|nr:hypothetical protein FRB96_008751 [Tulasnella sp. 330]KAG8890219.1 hypothetical protein FRB98_000547 [Tulasnella sp. 332]